MPGAYETNIIDVAHLAGDTAIFYDGTAAWDPSTFLPPCNNTTQADWDHFAFANQVVGPFLDAETLYSTNKWGTGNTIPFIVNENAEVSPTPMPQAAETVRAMIGHQIVGIKLEGDTC